MKGSSKLFLYFLTILSTTDSARFLAFFQIPAPSHHFIFRAVLEELAKRGHEVVYVTSIPYQKSPPKGITQLLLPKFTYGEEYEVDFVGNIQKTAIGEWAEVSRLGRTMGHWNLGSPVVQELIHSNQSFDAVMFETALAQEYLSAFIHKFNAIAIELTTLGDFGWANEIASLPNNPAYQLDVLSRMPVDMNFWQRLYNTYIYLVTNIVGYSNRYHMQTIMDQYFNYTGWERRPPLQLLAKNRSLMLFNFDVLFGYPYPVPPHRKDIAGIHLKPNKPLPKEIQTFMDESTAGVIYMSLGTHLHAADILRELKIFINVFKDLPLRVLLKLEVDYLGELPDNVKVSSWFPQEDILAHKNCALFITHGGLLSLIEATYYGIPLVGIPFFADQPKNVMFVEAEGFGRMLKFENVSHESISWTVREVLSNKRYKEEAVRRSKIFKDRRHTPAEEAVYWIEHSLKYPFALTPKATTLSAIQLHMIDIIIFIVTVLIAIIVIFYKIIKFTLKKLLSLKNKIKLKEQ